MKNVTKLIQRLALIGAFWAASITQGKDETSIGGLLKTYGDVTVKAMAETHNTDYAEGEMQVVPKAAASVGDTKVNYNGLFRRATNTDGETTELQTIAHNVNIGNSTSSLTIGRKGIREFGGVTTTTGFDNATAGECMNRSFTGVLFEHQPSHLIFGVVASDAKLHLSHLDTLLCSWSHRFDDILGIQLHLAVNDDIEIEKAGFAIEWKPVDRLSILADAIYKQNGVSGLLAANYNVSERTKLFAGTLITDPHDGDTTGKAIAGVESNLGHGFNAVSAVQQDFIHEGNTTFILGLKWNDNTRLW